MKKLALFTEGQTEQIFCEHLIRHLAGENRVAIQTHVLEGGRQRRVVRIQGDDEAGDHRFFVLLFNCGQDSRVISDVRERYDGLAAKEYHEIIALRDVYPTDPSKIPRMRSTFRQLVDSEPVATSLILAIMETEAWFLAEHTHLSRIHSDLSVEWITSRLGFNPMDDDLQLRWMPSKDLEDAYFLVKMIYDKSRVNVERTVQSMDIDAVCCAVAGRFPDLHRLVEAIKGFFG